MPAVPEPEAREPEPEPTSPRRASPSARARRPSRAPIFDVEDDDPVAESSTRARREGAPVADLRRGR